MENVQNWTPLRAVSAEIEGRGLIEHRSDARCLHCGAKVDPMEGVVAKVEVRGELARLWHVECWNKDNPVETGYGNRYWK